MSGSSILANSMDDVIDILDEDLKDNAFTKQTYSLEPKEESKIKPVCPITFNSEVKNSFRSNIAQFKSQINSGNIVNRPVSPITINGKDADRRAVV